MLMLVVYIQVICILCVVFLKALPKVLQNTSYDFLKEQDVYFIRLKIIRLYTHLDCPLTSKINEDGIRDLTNAMSNAIIHIGK